MYKNLSENLFDVDKLSMEATRDGYGRGIVEAGKNNKNIMVLCADLTESTRSEWFKKEFPERFLEMGVAEQNMVTVASGLANYGKIPFIASYAAFSPGRNWEQIRTTICLNNVPVKIVGAHAGISVGPDGATHQILEDIALMRSLPNMIVVVPCDSMEAKKATISIAKNNKPSYIRLGRDKSPVFTTEETPFEIGKAEILKDPSLDSNTPIDVAIIGCGQLVYQALLAYKELAKENISAIVVNNHTIKPLDKKTILDVAKKANAIVTVEEHQIKGGLGSTVAELLSQEYPIPIEYVGIKDRFGESGESNELLEKFNLLASDIVLASKKVISRKK